MLYAEDRDLLLELVKNRYKSPKKLNDYANYINSLVEKDLPPILSFRHLADTLNINVAYLRDIALNTQYFYARFSIPKRTGGFREIAKPYTDLEKIQQWIAQKILKTKIDIFPLEVTGYISGKSILDHVTPHKESDCLIKLDIKDFFPSITVFQIYRIYLNIGYSNAVARTLAALTTLEGSLPQGACTSPHLSNLRLSGFDLDFKNIALQHDLIYTRYADDIVVSGKNNLLDLVSDLNDIFIKHGFLINDKKISIYRSRDKVRFITGLTLNNGEIRLPKTMRRKIRAQAHLFIRDFPRILNGETLSQYDKFSALQKYKESDGIYDAMFIERILGKLNYWIMIEPNDPYPQAMKNKIYKIIETL